jgi:EmrB/QacA subfamily drug resistance transporter
MSISHAMPLPSHRPESTIVSRWRRGPAAASRAERVRHGARAVGPARLHPAEQAYAAELAHAARRHSGTGRTAGAAGHAAREAAATDVSEAVAREDAAADSSPRPPRDAAEVAVRKGPPRGERRRWIALAVLCLGQLMMVLDATIVNVALPAIQRDLHFTQQNLTWVLNGYLITFGGFLLLAGRMGDLVGRKRVFLTGLVLFIAASMLCGVAGDQTMLIVARLLQGVGGAVASSVILAIIVTEFPGASEQARAMGMFAFVSAGGGSIGLLAGGALTQTLDWHWIFFVNVPIGALAFALGWMLIEENEGIGLSGGVDWLGSVLMTAATMLGAFAIVKSTDYGLFSGRTLAVATGSLVLLAVFLWLESRLENPIMPLRILRLRLLMGSSVVRGLLVTGMFSAFFLGSLYLERVLGYDAIETGLAFMPLTVAIGALSLGPSAKAMVRFGAVRLLSTGLVAIISGLVLLAEQGAGASYFPGLFVAFLLLGLGAGASFLPLLTIGMADAPKRDAGLASGIVNVSIQLFGAIGLATLGTIATDHSKALRASGEQLRAALTGGYHLSYLVGAACVALGILAAWLVLGRPRGSVPQESAAGVEQRERELATAEPSAQLA